MTNCGLARLSTYLQASNFVCSSFRFHDEIWAAYIDTILNGGRTDRAEENAFYRPGSFSLQAGRIDDVIVRSYGETATVLATVSWEGALYPPAPGIEIDLSGRFSVSRVYTLREGRWQLALSHASRLQ